MTSQVTIQRADPGFAFFLCLLSVREELRASAPTDGNPSPEKSIGRDGKARKRLPRYVERDHRNGELSFRVDRGARIPLPKDPTTPEFRAAYSAALVDAIAAEDDSNDWSELEAMHRAQRRGTAKHGGQR